MLTRLLIIMASALLLVTDLIIRAVRRGSAPLGTKGTHLLTPHELYPVVIDQIESFLDEKIEKLMGTVAEIEAHAGQFQQVGYKLAEVSLYGNPLPGLALELEPGVSSENADFQALLHQQDGSKTFKLIVKLLEHTARYQRQYQFRGLACKRVSIRLDKEPSVQIVYQPIPQRAKPAV
ncbi:MAG: hypothetical protein WBW55_09830 [Desulfobaccales bacterium]